MLQVPTTPSDSSLDSIEEPLDLLTPHDIESGDAGLLGATEDEHGRLLSIEEARVSAPPEALEAPQARSSKASGEADSQNATARALMTAFKAAAVLFYFFGSFLGLDFWLAILIVVGCQVADFIVTKNIAAPRLVGLRWSTEKDENGERKFVYERDSDERVYSPKDSQVFWFALAGAPFGWALLSLSALLALHWMWMWIPITNMGISAFNFYQFWKCQKDAKQHVMQFMASKL